MPFHDDPTSLVQLLVANSEYMYLQFLLSCMLPALANKKDSTNYKNKEQTKKNGNYKFNDDKFY